MGIVRRQAFIDSHSSSKKRSDPEGTPMGHSFIHRGSAKAVGDCYSARPTRKAGVHCMEQTLTGAYCFPPIPQKDAEWMGHPAEARRGVLLPMRVRGG